MTAFEKEKYFHPANTSRKSVPAHNMAINNAADSGKERSRVWVARLFLSFFFCEGQKGKSQSEPESDSAVRRYRNV